MENEDARYQTLERLHERRKRVVRLHVKGVKIMQIVRLTGLSYLTVKRSIKLYERDNWEALRPADRGRSEGQGRMLSLEQEDSIRESNGHSPLRSLFTGSKTADLLHSATIPTLLLR